MNSKQNPAVYGGSIKTLEENISRAAVELTDGWVIAINVKAGVAWMDLYYRENPVLVPSAKSINEQVSEAISYANLHRTCN